MRYAVCIIAALCLAVGLAACDTPQDFEIREQTVAKNNATLAKNLPVGCTATYAGEYSIHKQKYYSVYSYPVIVVQCESKKAVTTNSTYRVGKTTESVATVVVED